MAKADVRVVAAGVRVPTIQHRTEAAATAIYAGEPVKLKSAGSVYVIPLADGEPVIGTTTLVAGIAAEDSSHTASADGWMEVYLPVPGVTFRAAAKSAAAADTEAEIIALGHKQVVFDLTSSSYTIDTAATHGATNGVLLTGKGDHNRSEVDFMFVQGGVLGN